MPVADPLPDTLAASGFTVAEARRLGVSRARTRARDLSAPFYGVRVRGEVDDVSTRAHAYAARMRPTQFFSHTTAAQLHDLRLPSGFRETELHVTSLAPTRPPRGAGVIGHGAEHATVTIVAGLRVRSAIETWCQLSATLSRDDLIVMGDGLIRRKRPLTSMAELRMTVSDYGGRGRKNLLRALDLMRAGTDSARETMLRLIVVRAGFPEPEVNGVILNNFGAEIAHGDLVFRRYRAILEYEGRQHSEDLHQFATDISRLDDIMEERWRVIRVDRVLMSQRATLLGKIDRALRDGGWDPSRSPLASLASIAAR